jgi:hypothetical protein
MPQIIAEVDGVSPDPTHRFIQFGPEPMRGINSEVTLLIVKKYLHARKLTRKQWKKEPRLFNVNWNEPNGEPRTSAGINYLSIGKHIREKGQFDPEALRLPAMECFWLDVSFPIQMNFHVADATGAMTMAQRIPQQQYGPNFPIELNLQREGHLYGSLQPQLTDRIAQLRSRVIENSHLAMQVEWIFDLRSLISDSISLVDITLNQLYIKAEYDLPNGWKFDREKLGERSGRRLRDKLKWVYAIAGTHIDIQDELESLNILREIRNHLLHLDPPCLIVTFEEAAIWLNRVIDVAMIAVKIRKAIGVEISKELINLLLQKEAHFVPRNIGKERKALSPNRNEDYYSSTWPRV